MVTMIEKSVPGFDTINQRIGDEVKDFKIIRGLRISYDKTNRHYNIDMDLCSDTCNENVISISCIDVSKYTADFSDIGEMFVSGLQIFSRSSDHLDRIGWELSDYEDGKIIILCREMRATISC